MARLLYIHTDGREFETDNIEDWKIDAYISVLRATVVEEKEWVMANGIRIKALPDLPPERPVSNIPASSFMQGSTTFGSYRRRTSVFKRMWWRATWRWRR